MSEIIFKKTPLERFGLPDFTSRNGSADRAAVLAMNQGIREGRLPRVFHDRMAVSLNIPPLDYEVLIRKYPDLNSKDTEIAHKAWQKFTRSTESEPYRVYRLVRGPQCRSISAR